MYSHLKNGDIVVSLDIPNPLEPDEAKLVDQLMHSAYHASVYKDQKTYHNSNSGNQAGVRSHSFLQAENLGENFVIRAKNDKLAAELAKTVERWDATKYKDYENKKAASVQQNIKLLHPTRFTDFFERDADEQKMSAVYEVYRAFRAHHRNHHQPEALPLSKEKGLSCSQFLGYSLKVAAIDVLFQNKIPDEISALFMQIEEIKKSKGLKKLSQIDPALIIKFSDLVEAQIRKIKPEDLSYLKLLKSTVKGKDVNALCVSLLETFKDLFTFKGYTFKRKSDNVPGLIDNAGLLALRKLNVEASILSEDDLKKLKNGDEKVVQETNPAIAEIKPAGFPVADVAQHKSEPERPPSKNNSKK